MHGIILNCSVWQMGGLMVQWRKDIFFMEAYEHMNDINVHDSPGRLDMCA